MHVHCLSVFMLVLNAQTLCGWKCIVLFYFYVNIPLLFFCFYLCYQIMFPIVENTRSSLQSLYLVSRWLSLLRKGSLIFYFLYNILLIFPQIVLLISVPSSFPAITSSPLLFVSNSKADITSCLQKKQTFPQQSRSWMEGKEVT